MTKEELKARKRANRRKKRQAEHQARMTEKEQKRRSYRPREEYIGYFNHERYSDPVACSAINAVVRERRRAHA